MRLFKNLTNLAFEYGNPASTVIFLLFALIFAFTPIAAVVQLTVFYHRHMGIDVDNGTLIFAAIVFAFGSFCSAYTFRGLIIRLRLRRLFHNTVYGAEYQAPANLSPIESEYLVTKSWNENQTNALLAELVIEGRVKLVSSGYELVGSGADSLSEHQGEFIKIVFKNNNHLSTEELPLLPDKTQNIAKLVENKLSQAGLLRERPLKQSLLVVFRLAFYVALFYSTIEVIYAIANGWSALGRNVGPTIPIPPYIIVLLWLVLAFDVVFVLSALGLSLGYSGGGINTWRLTAGFKQYLAEAYKREFISNGEVTVTSKEFKSLYPYAVAFGLDKLSSLAKLKTG